MSGEAMPNEAENVYAVRLSSRAQADIRDAVDWFALLSGDAVADEWREGIFEAIASLATLPQRCIRAVENSQFRQEVRQHIYRRRPSAPAYRIIFRILEDSSDGRMVRILHVRHGSARPISFEEAEEIESEE